MSSECLKTLKACGLNFFTGVADSLIGSLIEDLSRDEAGYVPAAREDLAVGMASGAFLAGRLPCVLMQNSGLGYCLNTLLSLNLIYKIPILLVIGHRGYQGKDAPEHWVIGRHGEAVLREVGIPVFSPEGTELLKAVEQASERMKRDQIPVALLIRPGVLESTE